MNTSSLTLRSISDLLSERFYIPAYQRGYRWTARQVTDLLTDIWTFRDEVADAEKKNFYCLQPVVVVPRDDGSWELIDGQQRLTTVHLILSVLRKQADVLEKSSYSLEYETRPGSAEFLANIDLDQTADYTDYFYFHFYEAYRAILKWFVGKDGGRKMSFLQCLLNTDEDGKNVKVIWYELPQGQEPVEVFVRLNMGKIPLTNSELIRGLFLRSRNFEQNEVTLKQLQIANEWDIIELAMQSSDFWGFIYGGTDDYPTRIEYLFKLITAELDTEGIHDDDAYGIFIAYNRYIESIEDDKEQLWRDVKRYFMTLDEWFRDRTLYHLVGYLVAQGMSVQDLKALSVNLGRTELQGALKQEVYKQLFNGHPADHEDRDALRTAIRERLSELSYHRSNQRKDIRSALLLFNIVTLLQNSKSAMRFPFDSFKVESWDLEHIKSVKSEMPFRRDTQKAWVQTVVDFWEGGGTSAEVDKQREAITEQMQGYLATETMSLEKATALFEAIYYAVLDCFDESEVTEIDNGLQNLTLLDARTNRSYKNAVFPIKRNHVRRLDKTATFVPICTTNVFLKYYSRNVDRMLFWTESDQEDYFAAIVDTMTDFFADRKAGEQ